MKITRIRKRLTRWRVEQLWRKSLDIESIDPRLSFMEAGGDSLKALEFVDRLKAQTGVILPIENLALLSLSELLDWVTAQSSLSTWTLFFARKAKSG